MTMICRLILPVALFALAPGAAQAIAPFKKAFKAKYVEESESDKMKAAFRKSSCNTCHVKGEKKDWLNAYGLELAKAIPGSAKQRIDEAKKIGKPERDAEKEQINEELQRAFEQVGELKSPAGISYDEMFQAGELPSDEGAKSVLEVAEE